MLDNYGKVEYYIISCPDEECEYSYSAKKLQEDLNSIVKKSKVARCIYTIRSLS